MDLMLFDEAAEALRALLPAALGDGDGDGAEGPLRVKARRYGLKVWFGAAERATPEHYEAQVLGARHVPAARTLALEIGFHCEHRDVAANDAVVSRLVGAEPTWRRLLGSEAEIAPFLGRPDDWRRISETWPDPDLGDPELGMEIGSRLADYLIALEPVRRAR